jgi:hypothetical protein
MTGAIVTDTVADRFPGGISRVYHGITEGTDPLHSNITADMFIPAGIKAQGFWKKLPHIFPGSGRKT